MIISDLDYIENISEELTDIDGAGIIRKSRSSSSSVYNITQFSQATSVAITGSGPALAVANSGNSFAIFNNSFNNNLA